MSEMASAPEQEVKPKKTRGKSNIPAPEGVEKEEGEAKEKQSRAARGSAKFSMDAKISITVTENPKQPHSKSYIRFAEYVDGMTCKEAIEKGVYLADLYYDSQHGFIAIEGYTPPPLVKKVKAAAKVEEAAPAGEDVPSAAEPAEA